MKKGEKEEKKLTEGCKKEKNKRQKEKVEKDRGKIDRRQKRGNKKRGQSKFKNCALRSEFWMNIFSWLKTFLYIFFSNLANEY